MFFCLKLYKSKTGEMRIDSLTITSDYNTVILFLYLLDYLCIMVIRIKLRDSCISSYLTCTLRSTEILRSGSRHKSTNMILITLSTDLFDLSYRTLYRIIAGKSYFLCAHKHLQ